MGQTKSQKLILIPQIKLRKVLFNFTSIKVIHSPTTHNFSIIFNIWQL